jgi:eukaryotic-like serine/threonine-protein kinase
MAGLESLLLGRVLGGRYRIEEVIGRGGMGAVYRAVDERLGRRVALKVITVAMGDDPEVRRRVRARFQREARAAAALPHHPNVVPVYDYGTDQELGLDYLVMELLHGHDLASRLGRSGPPPLATALRILREAARGLAVGHRAGLVHRDVKPGNIFLARDHDELQVRVVDFGIAKLADDEDTQNQLTQDGRIPHSPAYASPEQLRGLTQLTAASDVFSLGAVGYQLLTGERPFSEADRNRMSLGMPAPVPSLRAQNPAIPAQVEGVVQRALAFDATDRFPDAVEMGGALERALRELPDSPIEPYELEPIAATPMPPRQDLADIDDDDRTQLMGVGAGVAADDDDRTQLMDVEPVPAARAPGRPAPPPPISRPGASPAGPQPRRNVSAWVAALVLLLGAGAGVWALTDGGRAFRTDDPGPVVMDTLPADTAQPPQEPEPTGPTAPQLNDEGLQAFRGGQYTQALALFQQALDLEPGTPVYRQNIGITQLQMGRTEAARTNLEEAIRRDPNLWNAHGALAQIQLNVDRDSSAAEASLREFLNRAPANADGRAAARNQLDQIRINRMLVGEPVDTPTPPRIPPTAPAEPRDTVE